MQPEPIMPANLISSTQANLFWDTIIERIKEGVMLLSANLELIYLNVQALQICQQFWDDYIPSNQLPSAISQILTPLIPQLNLEAELIEEYQFAPEQTIRIRVHSFHLENRFAQVSDDCLWLLIFLEDRNKSLQEDLQIEQKKYKLTDREIQILNLLLQANSYREIARTLQISLNTVKFHIKNIYAKKRKYSVLPEP
jgi:hypothetical protein